MTKYQKIGIVVLFILICVSVTIYVFIGNAPPATPTDDRIAFVTSSSFPGLSALFLYRGIYVINVNSPGTTHVIRQSRIEAGLAWSPQGDKIAYYLNGVNGLYVMNADGSGQPELLRNQIFALHPAWSSDGKRMVFSNGVGSIYIFDLATKDVFPLLDETTKGSEPTWSPDSNQIVFRLNPFSSGPDSSIAVINIDGSNLTQLTPNDNSRSPEWSPDGNQIVFERNGNIFVMKVDGTNVNALTKDGRNSTPAWSPNGKRIVFVSTANQQCSETSFIITDAPRFCTSELHIMNADGSNVTILRSKENERVTAPVWAPRN